MQVKLKKTFFKRTPYLYITDEKGDVLKLYDNETFGLFGVYHGKQVNDTMRELFLSFSKWIAEQKVGVGYEHLFVKLLRSKKCIASGMQLFAPSKMYKGLKPGTYIINWDGQVFEIKS